MGLRDDIQADIAEAFDDEDGLADAVSPFVGTREIVGEYDPREDEVPTETVTYTGRGVFGGFSRQIIDQQHILSSDVKVTILQNELIGANGLPITPLVDDTIDGLRVIDVQQDPAGATWSLQCRGTRIPAVLNNWLLSSGAWDDSGAWSDSEAWNDNQEWIDG